MAEDGDAARAVAASLNQEDELARLQALSTQRDAELEEAKAQLLRASSARDQLGFQLTSAQALAERRLADLAELQATAKQQAKQLVDAQRREVEALQRAAEQEMQADPLRHRLARLAAELESSKQHSAWLESQAAEKTKFAQELRRALGKQTHELEELKSKATEELTSAKRQLESARQVSKKLEAALIQSKEQVKAVQAAKAHAEERLENELSAQRRLAELYKEAASDANARVAELQELSAALRRSLAATEEALALETERTKQQVEHLFREQAAASEQVIAALQEQLADATARADELEKKKLAALQTAASVADLSSAAGEAHLAAHGLSPTQLVDHVVELEAALRDERAEKEKLQAYMDRIVREVQEKAPIIMGLRLDHERAVASHAQMTERLERCTQQLATSKRQEERAWSEKRAFESKCASLAQTVDDLSRQVQHLLFRAQQSGSSSGSGGFAAAPGDVVSENLVVFRDVEELQVRNQQLLAVIRELSDVAKQRSGGDHATVSSSAASAHFIAAAESDDDDSERARGAADLNARLALTRKEVQELRAEREQERQMIAAIVKQRDMYRVLLAQSDNKFLEPSGSSSSNASTSGASAGADARSPSRATTHRRGSFDVLETKAVRDLQAEFDDYKKEKQANAKLLQEALEQQRAEASHARLAQMQAEVEAKCASERYTASEARRRDVEDEFVRVRAKNEQLSALLVQQQQLAVDTEAKLEDAVARAQSGSVEQAAAARELAYLKTHEAKLQQELSSLRVDNTNLLKLMESARATDALREERDRREQEVLAHKVTTLESRLQETVEKSEARDAVAGANLLAAEQEKKAALLALDKVRALQSDAAERLARLEEQKVAAESQVALLVKEATHLREQLRKGTTAAAAERVAALEVQLRDAQREAQASLALRKSLTENVARYKAIAEANEKSLAELSSASAAWKESQEHKLRAAESEREHLRAELAKARAQAKTHVGELETLRTEIERLEDAHRRSLQLAAEQQSLAQVAADGAQSELAMLRDELVLVKADLSSAQENYERELQLRSTEVAKAAAARKLLEDEQRAKLALTRDVQTLEARVAAVDREALEQLTSLREKLAGAAEANESLAQQNKLLHSQLERASSQVRRAHEQALMKSVLAPRAASDSAEPDASSVSARDDGAARVAHEREVDDLRSVIAFLRRESEIATSKLELCQQEVQRYRAQVLTLESTAERLRGDMKAAAAATSASSADAVSVGSSSDKPSSDAGVTDAAKRFAQLEQLSLLRESNATLRDESQRYLAKLKAEEAKVAALEAQLAPLRASETALKAQVAALQQEVATLNEANKRWKQRVEQLVEKYQQVDPAEHDRVVAENAARGQELAELKSNQAALEAELETLRSSEGKSLEEEKTKVENWRKQYDRIKGFAKTWKTKAENLTKQLGDKAKELDDKSAALVAVESKIKVLESDKAALEAKLAAAEAKQQDAGDAAAAAAQSEKERQELRERLETEQKKSAQLTGFNLRLMSGLKLLKKENADLRDQAIAMPSASSEQAQRADDAMASDASAAAALSPQAIAPPATTLSSGATMTAAPEALAPVAAKPMVVVSAQPPLPPLPPPPASAPAAPKVSPVAAAASAPASAPTTTALPTSETVASGAGSAAPAIRFGTASGGAPTSASSSVGGTAPSVVGSQVGATSAGTPVLAGTTTSSTTPASGAPAALGNVAPVAAKPVEQKAPAPTPAPAPAPTTAPPAPAPAPTTAPAVVAAPTTAAAAPAQVTSGASAGTVVPAGGSGAGGTAPAASAEEKLRLFALQSMMKKQGMPKAAPTAPAPATTGPGAAATTGFAHLAVKQPGSVTTTTNNNSNSGAASAKETLAAGAASGGTAEEDVLKCVSARLAASGSFLKLAPPTGAFGTFGSGGASGLVFGKPGITLPVPASPTPGAVGIPPSSVGVSVTSSATATASGASTTATTTMTTTTTTTATVPPVVASVETEAHRRNQRLARFAAAQNAAAAAASGAGSDGAASAPTASGNLVKRPASVDIGTPQKIARTASSSEAAGSVDGSEEETKAHEAESELASATPPTQPE
ncbi:hypothetical protein PybrP1_003838 [[Pythium] brassicae (nom. inval.)]|nr:hypothetical protein PybrP1_003838 [[Pythium] brassicae (nom. inval.)]